MSFVRTRVAVHGVPRSGTTWVGEILNSSPNTVYRFQPLFSYALKDYLTNASTRQDIDSFFEKLVQIDDEFLDQSARRRSGDLPWFDKGTITHIIHKEVRYINILCNLMRRTDDVHLCAVIRNPLAVINSWLRAPREFRADLGWCETEEWRYALKKNLNRPEEFNGYEKWKEAAWLFRHLKQQHPDRVYILKYESLLAHPVDEVESLFGSIGLAVTESTLRFLRESGEKSRSNPYSVYRVRQTNDQWKTQLDPSIVEQISSDLNGTGLQEYID